MKITFLALLFTLISLVFFGIKLINHTDTIEINGSPGEVYTLPKTITDTKLVIVNGGTKESPFIVKGNQNRTQLLGSSSIDIQAKNVILQDLEFIDNQISYVLDNQALIKIGSYNKIANNIVVQDCKFKYHDSIYNNDKSFFWIRVSGNDITVQNCEFEGKRNKLPIIHVDHTYTGVKIQNNIFKNVKPRKGEALEAIRIGLTKKISKTLVVNNIFENYHGDSETISCKADSTRIINNTFINSRNGVTLRWGSGSTIANNYFSNVKYAIRTSGKNHHITNNTFIKSKYDLIFTFGSESYQPVNNINVQANTFMDKPKIHFLKTLKGTVLPDSIYLNNNIALHNNNSSFIKKKIFTKNTIQERMEEKEVLGNKSVFYTIDLDTIH